MRPFITKKMIDKAKKKLKKLQKRQRKQDTQGVVSVDDAINAPVTTECLDITERLDVSEMPLTYEQLTRGILNFMKDKGLNKPTVREHITMTMSEFIKFRDKMARPS